MTLHTNGPDRMPSRLLTLHDHTLVEVVPPPYDEFDTTITGELEAFARKRAVTKDHEAIADGDIVRLDMAGPTARLTRKNATLAVGAGLLDAELERNLRGLGAGSHTVASSEGPVQVDIVTVQYRDVPAPSDEMVAAATSGQYANIREYRAQRTRELLREHAEQEAWRVFDAVIDASEFEVDPDDVERLVAAELDRCRAVAVENGEDFDSYTGEDLAARVGVESMEEFVAMVRSFSTRMVCGLRVAENYTGAATGEVTADRTQQLSQAGIDHITDALIESYDKTGATR